jgi:hypothetical protein
MMSDTFTDPGTSIFVSTGGGDRIEEAGGTHAAYRQGTSVGSLPPSQTPADTAFAAPDWPLAWMASEEARQYEGSWVVIGPDLVVRAVGDSPSDMNHALGDRGDLVILYVIPHDARIVG